MAIVTVENLVKKYPDFTAVNGVSFTVNKGEIFGLLGVNGAGKTTILEIIETLKTKTSGKVIVDGWDLDTHPEEIKKIIGVQLQNSGFYPHLNLKELIALFAGLYNQKVDADELLTSFQLSNKSRNKFTELSGGQKQRFSILITLINHPKIIILDEPTTGLDPQSRRHLWELIKSLKEEGKTILLTTHYMEEAEFLCDRIAIIDSGKMLSLDTPQNMIDALLSKGYSATRKAFQANLEDVFLELAGKVNKED